MPSTTPVSEVDVAHAWRDAWERDARAEGPPNICDGCYRPARDCDIEGVPLCDACLLDLEREHHRELTATVRELLAVRGRVTNGTPELKLIEKLRALVAEEA